MPPSMPLSSASASCRIEWRPSRWLKAALVLIALAGGVAVLSTDLPRIAAWPLTVVVVAAGLGNVRRESRRPARQLVLAAGSARLDGTDVAWCGLQWRGPIAIASLRHGDGCLERLAWWPDTLRVDQRRELRLAASAFAAAPVGSSVAP